MKILSSLLNTIENPPFSKWQNQFSGLCLKPFGPSRPMGADDFARVFFTLKSILKKKLDWYEPGPKLLVLGMVIQPLIGILNPYNGYINPYYWVDDHPLLNGNNGSLDPSTYETHGSEHTPENVRKLTVTKGHPKWWALEKVTPFEVWPFLVSIRLISGMY